MHPKHLIPQQNRRRGALSAGKYRGPNGLSRFPIVIGGNVRPAEMIGVQVRGGSGRGGAYHRGKQRPIRREDVLGGRCFEPRHRRSTAALAAPS